MNKRITFLLVLFVSAQLVTKAQMTVGGSYKPSHTLVVKGQVKIDTVKSGTVLDSLLTIGADSVLHRLPISSIADGSQTRLLAGTNTTVTGTGATASPYVVNAIIPATTHTVGVSGNTLTSTVNGVSATTPVIGSVSSTSSANSFSTTINGQTSSAVNIINTNTNALTQTGGLVNTVNGVTATTTIPTGTVTNVLGFSATGTPVYQTPATVLSGATSNSLGVTGNTLTSTVNGVAATAPVIGSVSNASTANTISTTINGQTSTGVSIINSNTNALTQTGGLVNTVNGVTATTAIPAGTATNILGFSSTGTPVYQTPATVLSGATSHTLGVSGNTLTSTVNGVAATASVIGTLSNTSSANLLTTTINGQATTPVNIINSNSLTNTNGSLVSTVNGVASTPAVPVLGSASNGLTATNGNVVLGGTLTGATTITGGTNKLSVTSSAVDGFAVAGTTLSVDGANSRVGIGTNAPTTKLHVTGTTAGGSFRMVDGTQGADKVLTSDANGNASWTTNAGNSKAVWATLPATNTAIRLSTNTYTGASITLPPGKWAVHVNMTLSTNSGTAPNIPSGTGLWVRSTFSDVNTGTAGDASADIIGTAKQLGGGVTGPSDYGALTGTINIYNSGTGNKTYYFWQKAGVSYRTEALTVLNLTVLGVNGINTTTTTYLSNFGTTAWSEDEIVATPINY